MLYYLFTIVMFILFYFFFCQLIVLLVAASLEARHYQEIRTSKAKGVATQDYSLSRFIGLRRAASDHTKKSTGKVHMDKRQCPANQMFMDWLFKYLHPLPEAKKRDICIKGNCTCLSGSDDRGCGPCTCTC